jgi:hypothetical protein
MFFKKISFWLNLPFLKSSTIFLRIFLVEVCEFSDSRGFSFLFKEVADFKGDAFTDSKRK